MNILEEVKFEVVSMIAQHEQRDRTGDKEKIKRIKKERKKERVYDKQIKKKGRVTPVVVDQAKSAWHA